MFNLRFFFPCALLVYSIAPATASDSEIDRASLRGLQGVFVLVEDLNPPEEQAGLKTADIQADAEEKLKAAGIPLLNKAQAIDAPGMPTLYISVSVASSTATGLWPFSIDVNLEQQATLKRSPDTFVPTAVTWHVGSIGAVDKSDILSIRDRLNEQIARFVNAYLKVNPKPDSAKYHGARARAELACEREAPAAPANVNRI